MSDRIAKTREVDIRIQYLDEIKRLEVELAHEKEVVASYIRICENFEAELSRYKQALKDIWQEAGKPTMAYASEVERFQRGQIIEKIADIAKQALKED